MNEPDTLERTFVELQQISNGLRLVDHQIMYGRRGTGKTHAFNHLAGQVHYERDLPIYVDLRRLGSNAGLYADHGTDLPRRATQLLIDVVEVVHRELLEAACEAEGYEPLLEDLDSLAEAATRIEIKGDITESDEIEGNASVDRDVKIEATIKGASPSISGNRGKKKTTSLRNKRVRSTTGAATPRILFGHLGRAMEDLTSRIHPRRIWLLLDEWSSLPPDLQPYLADMLRRTFFPCPGLTVKIGAVERRSSFLIRNVPGSYVGIELGADTAAALNLDEYLLESEAGAEAGDFFAELIFRHVKVLFEDFKLPFPARSPNSLVSMMFVQDAFREFVRAAEGVPRDGLNIIGLASNIAKARAICVSDVQRAARQYYLRDKELGISGNPKAKEAWLRLHSEFINQRGSRTFLLQRRAKPVPDEILDLYDARLIHLLKRGISIPARPGVLYDAYAIDYGSYISVMNEDELADAWSVRGQPWLYSTGEKTLPEHFDENAIFRIERNARSRRSRQA